LAWCETALGADKTYVNIVGIPGQSTDPGHASWIDANALDTKVTRGSGGLATFADIAILKGTDKATPLLHAAVTSGQIFSDVTVEGCRQGQSGQECYYRLELLGALVTGVDLSGSSCVGPGACTPAQTESVTLSFRTIKWVYTPYTNGTPGTPVSRCYDVVNHTSC
jgi:type VI secretion system Hcp family effector